MDKNTSIYKIINLFWVPIAWTPFFGGMAIIYAGYRVKQTKWIDEGIIYMIPFMMLTFIVFGITIPAYLGVIVCFVTIIRSIMLIKPFLKKLEEMNNQTDNTYQIQKEQQIPQKKEANPANTHASQKNIPSSSQTISSKTNQQIKINEASQDELLKIQSIDPATVQKIIQLRLNGIYIDSPEDLSKKLGLTNKQVQVLQSQINFSRNNTEKHSRIIDI